MKKQYPTHTLVILVLILISFTQCKKSDPPDEVNYTLKISPDALAYVQQPLGKYRIYRDSATSALDSVVVTESKLEMYTVPKVVVDVIFVTPSHNKQRYDLTLTKKNTSPDSTWFKGQTVISFYYPFQSTDTAPIHLTEFTPSLNFTVAKIIHPVSGTFPKTVEGVTYNNVYAYNNEPGLDINHPAYHKTIYYWAQNVGLIQRTTITTGGAIKTYYLVRHN